MGSNKFSYSKIDTFEQCGFKYRLRYEEGHYIFNSTIATEFGTLVHSIEEDIGNMMIAKTPIDYITLKNKFIIGVYKIQAKYPKDYFTPTKSGKSYQQEAYDYLENGIYRLEKQLRDNPGFEVIATEKSFNFGMNEVIFNGFIDRILYNSQTGKYIIQDIKTWPVPAEKQKLTTPLQFVVYTLAMKELYDADEENISCQYDLPLCDLIQEAGTKGYMARGRQKLDKLFEEINNKEFIPNPTPLCHWCEFCPTNPNQPWNGKNLCPYYSLWTKDQHIFLKAEEWQGPENHEKVLKEHYHLA